MGDLVNLRQARKQQARVQKERAAAENRAFYGRSKGELLSAQQAHERDAALLDGHRRERRPEDGAD